ncbi:MAG TPA: CPBP family intramembrane glutamic endopeptidase [Thermoanaerobaculia bacterium]|nr:CPBP family intramembrane glutamic endopeptidase [Thermoanaerobaculia bacterium]
MAWTFYLVLALAGGLWIGFARGVIPLALFVDRQSFALDLAIGVGAGLLLVGIWRLGRRILPAAEELESALARVLGGISTSEAVALALLSGFAEEIFFRGAVQGSVGFLPATLLFALLHSGPGRAFRLWTVFAAVAGLLFGGLMLWRGNLLAPFAGHFVVNAINLRSLSRRLGESARLTGPNEEES